MPGNLFLASIPYATYECLSVTSGSAGELSTTYIIMRMTLSPPLPNFRTAAMLNATLRLASGNHSCTRTGHACKKNDMDFQWL